jgi:hypothetical protein
MDGDREAWDIIGVQPDTDLVWLAAYLQECGYPARVTETANGPELELLGEWHGREAQRLSRILRPYMVLRRAR